MKKEDLSSVELHEPKMLIFKGEKKPKMPPAFSKKGILPLKVLCNQAITVSRSKYLDFQFVKDMVIQTSVPDFASYNTKQMRESGQSMKPKTKVIYKPLINKTPSDPPSILTAMCCVISRPLARNLDKKRLLSPVMSNCAESHGYHMERPI